MWPSVFLFAVDNPSEPLNCSVTYHFGNVRTPENCLTTKPHSINKCSGGCGNVAGQCCRPKTVRQIHAEVLCPDANRKVVKVSPTEASASNSVILVWFVFVFFVFIVHGKIYELWKIGLSKDSYWWNPGKSCSETCRGNQKQPKGSYWWNPGIAYGGECNCSLPLPDKCITQWTVSLAMGCNSSEANIYIFIILLVVWTILKNISLTQRHPMITKCFAW